MRNNLFLVTPAVEKWTITDVFIFSSLSDLFIPLLADWVVRWPVVSTWKDFAQVYNPDVSVGSIFFKMDFQEVDSLSGRISDLTFDSLEIIHFGALGLKRGDQEGNHLLKIHWGLLA